jgi:hypothetical protein
MGTFAIRIAPDGTTVSIPAPPVGMPDELVTVTLIGSIAEDWNVSLTDVLSFVGGNEDSDVAVIAHCSDPAVTGEAVNLPGEAVVQLVAASAADPNNVNPLTGSVWVAQVARDAAGQVERFVDIADDTVANILATVDAAPISMTAVAAVPVADETLDLSGLADIDGIDVVTLDGSDPDAAMRALLGALLGDDRGGLASP